MIALLTRIRGILRSHLGPTSAAGSSKLEDGSSYSLLKNARIAQQREREVDIVICVHNALECFRDCLASVLKTLGPKHRVIVVDDASDQPVGDYLATLSQFHSQLRLHRNERRTGYTRAANIGLQLSSADFVILLNSDTIVAPNWIEKLCDAVYTTDGAGIVGPLSSAASFQSIPNHLGTALQTATNDLPPNMSVTDVDLCCEAWTTGSIMPKVPLVHGFCFGIRRAVLDKIGLFDESLFPDGYGEENDYCFRASDAGFALVIATQTYVFHAKTKSYSLLARSSLAEAAERKVRERHGDDRVNQAHQQLESNQLLKNARLKAAKLYRNAPLVQIGASSTIQNSKARRSRLLIVGHLAGDQLFGAERSLLDIVAAIDPAKYEVLVALPNHNDAYVRRIEKHAKQVTIFPYEWWSASRKEDPATVERFATIIRRDRVDLIHVNTIALLDPLLAARQVGVPSILHARELIQDDAGLAAHFGSDVVHTVCSAADYIIANSDATQKQYSQNKKNFRLYNCVEPECFEVPLSLESGKLKVGLISSNLPKKGIESFVHLAITASECRSELEFFLIGPLNEYASSLREKVQGQASNIHFVDYLQHPVEALRLIDVLVSLSSIAESFGRTVAEAMAAGRPVVVYRNGALPELVRDGIDGFLIPNGAHLVALECLERLLDDPSLVLEIGRRGRERAKQLFSPGVFAPQLNRIYGQILSQNLRPSCNDMV